MKYEIGNNPNPKYKGYPLLPWTKIFGALSISQFELVAEYLYFPLTHNETLRTIARDFTHAELRLRKQDVPGTPDVDLLAELPSEMSYEQSKEALFFKTFDRLDDVGYGQILYEWCRTTEDFHPHADVDAIIIINRLLFWWVLGLWRKTKLREFRLTFELRSLLETWNTTLSHSNFNNMANLSLDSMAQYRLIEIVLETAICRSRLEKALKTMLDSPKSEWEDRVFYPVITGTTWTSLQGHFFIGAHAWRAVHDIFPEEEVRIIEQWAEDSRSELSSSSKLQFPLLLI